LISGEKSLTKDDILNMIKNDPDFIRSAEYHNSIKELMKKYPQGVSDPVIARVLMINKDKVQEIYEASIKTLKEKLKEDDYE